jgi:CRISPR/Cas system CSM-associated protein Csm2 small subunit
MTFSAGVALAKPRQHILTKSDEAERALNEHAKISRDSIHALGCTIPWTEFPTVLEGARRLTGMHGEGQIRSAFLHNLMELHCRRNKGDARWHSLLFYQIERNLTGAAKNFVKSAFLSPGNLWKHADFAVRYAMLGFGRKELIMPDMRDAMQGAGFRGQRTQGNRPGRPNEGAPATNPFPQGYPKYFDSEGHLRVALITAEAEKLAMRFESDRLKRHQLRSFYDHTKRQLQRLAYGVPFEVVHPEFARLKAFAADRVGRAENALPQSFKLFIDRNVEATTDKISFRKDSCRILKPLLPIVRA